MVSDSEIVSRLREFLETSDLTKTTTTILRRRLEEDLGIDLSEKRDFIRVQIDLFLQSKEEEQQQEVQQEEEETQEKEFKEEGEDEQEEEEEEEEDEEEESNGKGSKKRGSSKLKTEVKKRGGGGFCKLCCLSPQLQEFTGVPEMARTEVVKQIWAYIKEKDLQEPSNRRKIRCDEKLHSLFKVDIIDMFQMNKALAKHIWPLGSDDTVPSKSISKEKQPKQETEEDEEEPKRKGKKQKGKEPKGRGGTSGILCPLQLSDALVKFFGTVDSALPRSEVVKRIWDYIKENNLQDPADRRRIICDEKLKELFNVDTFNGFTVSKLLTTHLTKIKQ